MDGFGRVFAKVFSRLFLAYNLFFLVLTGENVALVLMMAALAFGLLWFIDSGLYRRWIEREQNANETTKQQ